MVSRRHVPGHGVAGLTQIGQEHLPILPGGSTGRSARKRLPSYPSLRRMPSVSPRLRCDPENLRTLTPCSPTRFSVPAPSSTLEWCVLGYLALQLPARGDKHRLRQPSSVLDASDRLLQPTSSIVKDGHPLPDRLLFQEPPKGSTASSLKVPRTSMHDARETCGHTPALPAPSTVGRGQRKSEDPRRP